VNSYFLNLLLVVLVQKNHSCLHFCPENGGGGALRHIKAHKGGKRSTNVEILEVYWFQFLCYYITHPDQKFPLLWFSILSLIHTLRKPKKDCHTTSGIICYT